MYRMHAPAGSFGLSSASKDFQRSLDGQARVLQNEWGISVEMQQSEETHIVQICSMQRSVWTCWPRLSKVAYSIGQRDHELKARHSAGVQSREDTFLKEFDEEKWSVMLTYVISSQNVRDQFERN